MPKVEDQAKLLTREEKLIALSNLNKTKTQKDEREEERKKERALESRFPLSISPPYRGLCQSKRLETVNPNPQVLDLCLFPSTCPPLQEHELCSCKESQETTRREGEGGEREGGRGGDRSFLLSFIF